MTRETSNIASTQVAAKQLPPSLKQGLRAIAVAGKDFEPFVEWIVSSSVIDQLIARGLAEQGDSYRPSVGATGYRLSEAGWEAVNHLWGYSLTGRPRQLVF